MKTPIPWLRVFAEGAVIVLSILLAFGIDAWWEGRQERAEELDMLTRLHGELSEVETHLQAWREHQVGVADAGREILANTGSSPGGALPADSIGKLIWKTTFNWDADPPTGVLSSAIATGQIALIDDADLREALVRWEAAFLDLRRAEEGIAGYNDRRIMPYLEARLAWRTIMAGTDDPALGESTHSPGVRELLREREFESIMSNRVIWVDYVVGKYDEVLADLSDIRRMVDAGLS